MLILLIIHVILMLAAVLLAVKLKEDSWIEPIIFLLIPIIGPLFVIVIYLQKVVIEEQTKHKDGK